MTEATYYQQDTALWYQLIAQEKAYLKARRNFLNCHSRVELIRLALQNPLERVMALKLLDSLNSEERESLFDELIKLASVGHSDIELVRSTILSFDKRWLLDNIENRAESLLVNGTDEEYRRLLELYIQIDNEITQKLVMKALQHSDPQVQEAGEDFENYLKTY